MPVNADLRPGRVDLLFKNKLNERDRAHGRDVSSGVAEHQSVCAVVYGSRVELLHGFRIAARGVFGDIHDFQTKRNRVFDGFFSGPKKEVAGPALGIASDGTRPNKCSSLDRKAGFLDDLRDGANV